MERLFDDKLSKYKPHLPASFNRYVLLFHLQHRSPTDSYPVGTGRPQGLNMIDWLVQVFKKDVKTNLMKWISLTQISIIPLKESYCEPLNETNIRTKTHVK